MSFSSFDVDVPTSPDVGDDRARHEPPHGEVHVQVRPVLMQLGDPDVGQPVTAGCLAQTTKELADILPYLHRVGAVHGYPIDYVRDLGSTGA